jgi:exodeoxyribonuclease V gamma subunit
LEVIRAHLDSVVSARESGVGFLNGAVTFCALKPMRAIPFRVVAVLGLDEGALPRHVDLVKSTTSQRGQTG